MKQSIDQKIQTTIARLHQTLRLERERRGYSQEVMAAELGMSPKAYQKIESGRTRMQIEHLLRIGAVLDIDAYELVRRAEGIDNSQTQLCIETNTIVKQIAQHLNLCPAN